MFLAAPAIALANSASKPMGHTAPLLPTPPSMGAPAPTGPASMAMGAAMNPAAVSYYSCKISFSARNILKFLSCFQIQQTYMYNVVVYVW